MSRPRHPHLPRQQSGRQKLAKANPRNSSKTPINPNELQVKLDALQTKLQLEADLLQLVIEDIRVRSNPLTLEIVIDKTEGIEPVDLELVAQFSRIASAILDHRENDPLPKAYLLEVSTRGAEAELTNPRHYARNLGKLLRIKLGDGTKIVGRLRRASETEFQIEIEKVDESTKKSAAPNQVRNANNSKTDKTNILEKTEKVGNEKKKDDKDGEDIGRSNRVEKGIDWQINSAETTAGNMSNTTITNAKGVLTISYAKVEKARPLIELNLSDR